MNVVTAILIQKDRTNVTIHGITSIPAITNNEKIIIKHITIHGIH